MGGDKSEWQITEGDLRRLGEIGLKEHKDFFARNARLAAEYEDRLLMVCLRQSAARHYADPGFNEGFGDLDIWLFYEVNPRVRFPDRAHNRTNKPRHKGKDVDVLRRAVVLDPSADALDGRVEAVLRHIERRRKATRRRDRKPDALVGIFPDHVAGKVLWLSSD